ncbi:MAG: NACHT domain-containing protein [Chloroflexaceae bacterium]|nr:NACHT domain-containing protein [Chloroflexaceae bacterium]
MKWLISKRRRMLTFFGSTTAIGLIWVGIVTQLFGAEIRGWLLELWQTQPLLLLLLVVVTVLLPTGIWIIAEMSRPNDGSTNGPGRNPEPALKRYLNELMTQCNALALSDLDATDATNKQSMPLDSVYIALHTTTQIEQEGQNNQSGRAETRPLTALETLSQQQPARTMLLGAPGSGKSTFVNHLTYRLARAMVDAQSLEDLTDWRLGPLLPIRVILRDLAEFASSSEPQSKEQSEQPKQLEKLALLQAFWLKQLTGLTATEALPMLQRELEQGRALLLFDGLDEVVDKDVLKRIAASITTAAAVYRKAPVLVTCRVLDYEREPLRQLDGSFRTYTLAGLTKEQITEFVKGWYTELAQSGRRTPEQAQKDSADLQLALAERPELGDDLAPSPLLLTVMALVHANRGRLPDAEATLYYVCIDLLLLRWRKQVGNVLTPLNLPRFQDADLLALMARLGWEAHEQAALHDPNDTKSKADLNEKMVVGIMAETFAAYADDRRYDLGQKLCESLERGNGLLLKRGPAIYTFPHRTFQEFLAGYYLRSRDEEYQDLALERSQQPHWQKALLLMVGFQVFNDGMVGPPLKLAQALLQGSASQQVLAGEALLVIGHERARTHKRQLIEPGGLWTQTRDALLQIATQEGQPPDAPASLRADARGCWAC